MKDVDSIAHSSPYPNKISRAKQTRFRGFSASTFWLCLRQLRGLFEQAAILWRDSDGSREMWGGWQVVVSLNRFPFRPLKPNVRCQLSIGRVPTGPHCRMASAVASRMVLRPELSRHGSAESQTGPKFDWVRHKLEALATPCAQLAAVQRYLGASGRNSRLTHWTAMLPYLSGQRKASALGNVMSGLTCVLTDGFVPSGEQSTT